MSLHLNILVTAIRMQLILPRMSKNYVLFRWRSALSLESFLLLICLYVYIIGLLFAYITVILKKLLVSHKSLGLELM